MSVPTISAPPSVEAVQKQALNNLALLLASLGPALSQAKTDEAMFSSILTTWPANLPTDLKPVVQVLSRLTTDVAMLAQGILDLITAMQAV